jgi:hypothetical protein
MWCIRLATTGTERLVRNPVLTNREQAWFVVSKGIRWCTRQAATCRKCQVKSVGLVNKEMAPMATLYRVN